MTFTSDTDGRSPRERMVAGDPYFADDPELQEARYRASNLLRAFNATAVEDASERRRILTDLLSGLGEDVELQFGFRCEYGFQIRIGARSFANFNLVALDVARITIGDDVLIGPNVQLLTATHPTEPARRRAKVEWGEPITIEDNVWLGGGVIVCPGVRIGENTVVGAGSVVVRDVPANVLAAGNPARIVRSL